MNDAERLAEIEARWGPVPKTSTPPVLETARHEQAQRYHAPNDVRFLLDLVKRQRPVVEAAIALAHPDSCGTELTALLDAVEALGE